MKIIVSFIFVISAVFLGLSDSTETILSPDEIIEKLKEGNERFVNLERTYPHLNQKQIAKTAKEGQFPFATIIGCSDSRVPIEHIFDAGIGDLFIIRVAGNVVNTDEAGSIEYGVEHLHTPLLVVMGHSGCGAVTAVVKNANVHGNIPKLIENIKPAVDKAHREFGDEFSGELLSSAIKNNVYKSIEDLFHKSEATKELVEQNELKVIGAIYHLESGKVEWLGEHPEQKELLEH